MRIDENVQILHILKNSYRSNVHFLHITNFDQFREGNCCKNNNSSNRKTKRVNCRGILVVEETCAIIAQVHNER